MSSRIVEPFLTAYGMMLGTAILSLQWEEQNRVLSEGELFFNQTTERVESIIDACKKDLQKVSNLHRLSKEEAIAIIKSLDLGKVNEYALSKFPYLVRTLCHFRALNRLHALQDEVNHWGLQRNLTKVDLNTLEKMQRLIQDKIAEVKSFLIESVSEGFIHKDARDSLALVLDLKEGRKYLQKVLEVGLPLYIQCHTNKDLPTFLCRHEERLILIRNKDLFWSSERRIAQGILFCLIQLSQKEQMDKIQSQFLSQAETAYKEGALNICNGKVVRLCVKDSPIASRAKELRNKQMRAFLEQAALIYRSIEKQERKRFGYDPLIDGDKIPLDTQMEFDKIQDRLAKNENAKMNGKEGGATKFFNSTDRLQSRL